jgi:hypothetical protein
MLTQLRRPLRLSFGSSDSLICTAIETMGTLYQKDQDRFHLVLTEPQVSELGATTTDFNVSTSQAVPTPRLLWLEFSPFRVTITMQGNGQFSYRHLFEPNVFGVSRFWLQNTATPSGLFRLRNFTRNLHVKGNPFPRYLLLEYELWAQQLKLGDYEFSVEIDS